ncbi:MAG: hypothetical protein A2Z01_07215 [Betaproteobacteria bacterium RBG_16_58_11]|nr:MAG: hypothetical protein A2Z01_07215 [Betaproteobacteria bacterium RBG_16_58_11]
MTLASRDLNSTFAFFTPSTFSSAFFTVIGHTGQSIPGTDRVIVCTAASAALLTSASTMLAIIFRIFIS